MRIFFPKLSPDTVTQADFARVVTTANLRGLIVWSTVMLLGSLAEIEFGLYDAAYRHATVWEIVGYASAIGGAFAIMLGRPTRVSALFPPVGITILLLLMQHTLSVSAWGGRLEDCYPLVLLGIPIVSLYAPRTLGGILAVTTLSYLVFVIALPPLPNELKLIDARDAVLACGAAIVASKLIYDPRRREWHQRFLIEARGRELEEHYAQMDELMAVTAHDLRSPLLGLRNLVQLTLDRASDDPRQALASLHLADRSLRSVLVLVNGLLNAHEAERGVVGTTMQWDLRLMLADLVERTTPSAQAAGVDIRLDVPVAPVTMVTDFHAVSRIIDNLVANAIRFTPSGSSVTIASQKADGIVTITVHDEGPGVPVDDVDRIFDKFYRGDMAIGDRQHGSGLGLFIARQIANNLGGTLIYQPNEPVGSTFVFSIAATEFR